MKIGIRAHDLGTSQDINSLVSELHDLKIKNIQLVFKKALKDYNFFTRKNAIEVGKILQESDINVAMLGAYFNPVHSNKELVRKNIEYFKCHLRNAKYLNCTYVGSETGSYNDDKWTYNPKNQTEEGYQESLKAFKELVKTARKYKTTILMEPAWGHVMYCVDQLKRAKEELNSKYVKVTIDIFNLLYIGNYQNYKEIFTYALSTFKDDIKIIHLKDFFVENDKLVQTGLGKGIIDFKFIVGEVRKYCPDATMVFEGVVGDDIKSSLKLINKLI